MKKRTPEELDRILEKCAAGKSVRAVAAGLGLKKSAVWGLTKKHAARLQEIREHMARSAQPTLQQVVSNPGDTGNEPLTRDEQDQYAACEAVIRRGLKTFYEVGLAYQTIRDRRLYRGEYKSFAEYCEAKLNTSKTQANRDIAAAVVVQTLNDPAAQALTEWQLRPLTMLPPDKLPTVWKKAQTAGKPITRELLLSVAGHPKAKAKAEGHSATHGTGTALHKVVLQAVEEAEAALIESNKSKVAAALQRIRKAVEKAA
ncbi:MAG: hypothetical protein WCH99_09990 [Verrucomicrobiota bacterium]